MEGVEGGAIHNLPWSLLYTFLEHEVWRVGVHTAPERVGGSPAKRPRGAQKPYPKYEQVPDDLNL